LLEIRPVDEESIFTAALAKASPEERLAFLDEACHGDAELRFRVEALLQAHEHPDSFLERGSGDFLPTGDGLTERPGTVIGAYRLLEQIGEGGFGVVYRAEQQAPVRRHVALKVLKPGMDTRQVVARFEAERQALALMDHPHIAKVLDAGATPSDRPYFVMELVPGSPITQYCDDHHLTPRQRLELFVPVCQALQHAHQKGIIHRDVKPSNVLVTLCDGRPVPKVIDFGVAKATGPKLTERTLFTQVGILVGTLEYMSPEQAGMSAQGSDTRSDIYSLGVLLYELLTGSTPLSHQRVREAAFAEVLRIIQEEEPPRPSARLSDSGEALASICALRQTEPAKLTRLVRGELDWIVMKALEKDRNRRYETANGFAMDVQRYLADEEVQACPPSAGYRLRKFLRRHKGPVAAVVALATLLVLGIVGTSIGLAWALRAEKLATDRLLEVTQEKERTKEEAAVAKAVNDFLQKDLLAQAQPEKNARNRKVTVEDVLGRAAERIAGKFENQPHVEAAIRLTIGDTYWRLGDYPAAQPHLERALELRRRVLGEEHPSTLDCMKLLAALYVDQGAFAKAEPLTVRALELSRRVLGEEHPNTVAHMNDLAILYQAQGQSAKAEPLWAKTLEVRRRVLGEEHPNTLTSLINLAALYWTLNELGKAEPLLVKALDVSRRVLGEEHPNTLSSRNNLAGLYQDLGQFDKSERLKLENLEIGRRVLGEEHPKTLSFLSTLGLLYQAQGKLAEAEPLFDQALKVSRRVLGEEHPDTLASLSNLASLYRDQGRFAEAEPLYLKTLEARRRVLGEEHPYTLYSLGHLAMLYQAQGDLAKAEPIFRETLAKVRKQHGEASPRSADALASLGENVLKQRRFAEAEPLLRECLTIREQKKPDDWRTFQTKSMLGGSLLGQQKFAEAEPPLLDGYAGLEKRQPSIPAKSKAQLADAVERLVQLYDAWGKPDRAAQWRAKEK
jgi:serine/threonine protein kinase/tetratricopeptide (TPR) repeat protein